MKMWARSPRCRRKIEWVEVFIFAVYGVELVKALAEALEKHSLYIGVSLIAMALGSFLCGYLLLKTSQKGWLKGLAPLVLLVFAVLFFARGWYLKPDSEKNGVEGKSKTETQHP